MKLRNQKGGITLDFLFAFVLVMGISALLFALSLTLVVVEVVQYATYSAARSYFLANIDEPRQRQAGTQKFIQTVRSPVVGHFFQQGGWFELPGNPTVGDVRQVKPEFRAQTDGYLFHGVATRFVANVLNFNIPFFGSTANQEGGSGAGFETFIGSYLGREPNFNECLNFFGKRWDQIKQLDPVYANGQYPPQDGGQVYAVMVDNGC